MTPRILLTCSISESAMSCQALWIFSAADSAAAAEESTADV